MRILVLLSCLLCYSAFCQQSWFNAALNNQQAPVAAGAACPGTPTATQNSSDGNQAFGLTDGNGNYYVGMFYTNAASINVCRVEFHLSYVTGDISTKTYVAKVWTVAANGTALGTLLGTSGTVAGNNSWSQTTVSFVFSTAVSVSANTPVIITCNPTQAGDLTNYAREDVNSAGGLANAHEATWDSTLVRNTDFPGTDLWINIYYF